jgi:hypothetical protein
VSHRDKLDEIFRAVAGQMQADFQATRRLVQHRGLKGKAAENNLVATFLDRYLPATLTIRQNAEVVSSAGDVSPECDVLICDPSTPPLWSANNVDIVPVESLYGLIEVKSALSLATCAMPGRRLPPSSATQDRLYPERATLETGCRVLRQAMGIFPDSRLRLRLYLTLESEESPGSDVGVGPGHRA